MDLTIGNTKDATALVIWLHGLGDTPAGWSDFGESLTTSVGSGLTHTKWILPCAPTQKGRPYLRSEVKVKVKVKFKD
jgi:hypothetical protein